MSRHPSRNCWTAGEKRYVKEEGGVIPQPSGPAAVIHGSAQAASRKHIYSIKAASPQACPIKNKKGRKLSGARTAPYKAARPQAYANP
jgi:hypothetical protein